MISRTLSMEYLRIKFASVEDVNNSTRRCILRTHSGSSPILTLTKLSNAMASADVNPVLGK